MDFATLEIIVDATQAERATDKLDELSEAGERAEKSTDKLSGSTRSYSGAASRAAEQAARQAAMTTAGTAALAALTAATVAATAVTAAMIVAWRRRQEIMEEARRETERAIQTLEDLRRETELARQGPGAEWIEPLRLANEELERMRTGTRTAWDDLKEMASTMVQVAAGADSFWGAISNSFWESDTGQGLRDIRDAIMDIDRLTGGRLAKQIELNRLAKEEATQAQIHAGEQARIAALLEASARVEERLRRQAEDDRRAAEEVRRQAERAFQDEINALERGAELRHLTGDETLRAWEIEERLRREIASGNVELAERNRLQEQYNQLRGVGGVGGVVPTVVAGPGGFDPTSNAGMILSPVTAHGAAPTFTFQGPTEEEIEQFVRAMEAARELTSGIRDLANAMDILSPALADTIRGVETAIQGAIRMRESQGLTGLMGTLGMASGGLSVVAGIVEGLRGIGGMLGRPGEAEQQAAIESNTEALNRLRASLEGDSPVLLSMDNIQKGLEALDALTAIGDVEFTAEHQSFLDWLREVGGIELAPGFADDMREWLASIQEYRDAMEQDVRTRILVAQGRDEEVAAMERQIARDKELAIAAQLGDEGLTELLETLYGLEDAALEAAKAAEEAARQFSIMMAGLEIDARRAALEGRDREAFILRSTMAAEREKAAWEDAWKRGEILPEQFTTIVDIINDELTQSIIDFDQAVTDLRKNLTDDLTLKELIQAGDERGAALFRNQSAWDTTIAEAEAAGMGPEFFDRVNQYYETEAARINQRFDALAVDGLIRSVNRSAVDDEIEQSVVRNARSITSMQASALVDIGRSQLAVLQDIARNTRRMAGGSFIETLDERIGARGNNAALADGTTVLP